jgi:outer membrane immunogenic protein
MRTTAAAALSLIVTTSSLAYADGMPSYPGSGHAPFSWTGFYIGGNAGYGWADDRHDIALTNNFGVTIRAPGVEPEGGFGGGQLGYNWQQGHLLLGVEADLQAADINDGFSGRAIDGVDLDAHQRINYFGTVRGRVGIAFDRVLVYATGGFAYGGVRDQLFVFSPGVGLSANLHNDDTRGGSVVGGGVELALAPHWSVKAEYQHIDLGSERLTAPVLPPNGFVITSNKLENNADTVRIGLNYRFDSDRYYAPLK